MVEKGVRGLFLFTMLSRAQISRQIALDAGAAHEERSRIEARAAELQRILRLVVVVLDVRIANMLLKVWAFQFL